MSLNPPARNPHPTDVIDDEWALVATYLLLPEDTLQRRYSLRFGRSAYYVAGNMQWSREAPRLSFQVLVRPPYIGT